MMAYFKLAVNLNDDESFKRVVNKPARGIGDTSLSALAAAAHEYKTSLFKAAFAEDLERFGLKNAAVVKIRAFCEMINRMCLRSLKEDAYTVATALAMESGLLMFYKSDTSIEGQSRTANVEELLNGVKVYIDERHAEMLEEMQADGLVDEGVEIASSQMPAVTLIDYLENVSLLSAVDVDDEEDGNNKISMMTVHSSKGLEYPYVYVVGMEENLFPSGGWLASESDVEEERRLCYVAITRAKQRLYVTTAASRLLYGQTIGAIGTGYAAHDHPTGIQHHHHVAAEAFAADGFQNDAVTVLVDQAPGVGLGSLILRLSGDDDEGSVGVIKILDGGLVFHGRDLFFGEEKLRQEADGAGLPDGEDKKLLRGGGGAFGHHIHHAV